MNAVTSFTPTLKRSFRTLSVALILGSVSFSPASSCFQWGIAPAHAETTGGTAYAPYGVIEVGSKGVKGFVFDLDRAENGTGCSADEDQYLKCLDAKVLDQINCNPVDEKSVADTAKAVSDQYAILRDRYLIDPKRIHVVGSSGVARIEHKDRLKLAIEDTISPAYGFSFISADQEAMFAFDGVMGMIPSQWREDRKKRTVVIDIGSGNTKGSFLEITGKNRRLVTFELPWGTKTFTEKVNRDRGVDAFASSAALLRQKAVVPDVRSALDNKQGAANRDRVYLIGGIVWALSNLTQPDSRLRFPKIYPEHIDTLLSRASSPNAVSKLCTDNKDADRNKDIGKICNTFTVDNIVSGLNILKALSHEMNFDQRKVFFIRDSLFAWPFGYLRSRVYKEED